MMQSILLILLLCFSHSLLAFNKVVIWGHKLHTHTHSYIHNAFYKAFQELGYRVYWFDHKDSISEIDLSNALFITEGQDDKGIPILDDGLYVLHNCEQNKYKSLFNEKRAFTLQVYTDDVLSRNCQKVAPCIYYDTEGLCLYMPWATDLLPREIENVKRRISHTKKNKLITWIGTIGEGEFGNVNQITPFKQAAASQKIKFKHYEKLSVEENQKITAQSYMAPAIVGKWQEKKGYIPCRIFKNISYGQLGITNSFRVYELFEGKIVYNPDCYQLFFDAKQRLETMSQTELFTLIDFVRDHHTYINRIKTIIDFVHLYQPVSDHEN